MDKFLNLLAVFFIFFVIVYFFYYGFIRRPFIRARKKQREKKMSADLSIMKNYYKIDLEKIGYNSALRWLNFVNAFLIAIIMVLIIGIKLRVFATTYIIQMVVAALLVFPLILGSYWLVSRIFKRKERKIDNV